MEIETARPSGEDARKAALAYVLGMVSGVFCLWRFPDRPYVRFHAWQSALLWIVIVLLMVGASIVPIVGRGIVVVLLAGGVVTSAALVWRAWSGAWTMLPLVGDIALEQALPRRTD